MRSSVTRSPVIVVSVRAPAAPASAGLVWSASAKPRAASKPSPTTRFLSAASSMREKCHGAGMACQCNAWTFRITGGSQIRRELLSNWPGFGSMPAGRDGLPAAETRFAFVDKGLSGFAVVLGEPGVRMVGHFEVHAFTQLAGNGAVQVLLHVAVSNRRPLRQPAGALHDLPFEVDGREDG